MHRFLVISLTLFLSLLSVTGDIFAYEQNKTIATTHSCCNHDENTTKHNCCQSHESPKTEHSDNCDGKCNGTNCQQNNLKFQLFTIIEKENDGQFFADKKDSFYDKDSTILPGFSSIWLLPKIA